MTCKKDYSDIFEITPNFQPDATIKISFENYISSLKELLEAILKNTFFQKQSKKNTKNCFVELDEILPIIHYSNLDEATNYFSFTILCNGQFNHGIGRFVGDMLCKWLIPGKQVAIQGNRSLNFAFVHSPKQNLFITEYFVCFEEKDLSYIKTNIVNFTKQLRLTILAVFHARMVISMKNISEDEKSTIIQENIFSLLNIKEKESEPNAFDHLQNFLVKISAEKNLSQIHSNLSNLMNKYPNSYDRDIFESIHNVSLIFSDLFTADRDPKYVSRLVSYYYLFKKLIKQKTFNSPNERHIHFKFFKPQYIKKNDSQIIGTLLVMNLIDEREHFDQTHMLQALKSILGEVKYVKSSFLSDKRNSNFIFFYLEVEKQDLSNFSWNELINLKKNFISEVKDRIEKSINPIFMPRNEEEVIRNIILLSKQLKYVKDIPQLIITYEKQTEEDISFIVILLRLIKDDTLPLKEYFSYSQTFLKFLSDEIKIVGSLKKKYPKEANIFRVLIKKSAFYRKDYSLDLQKARQTVVSELAKILGDFRDYNGGMILKQNQALDSLKNLVSSIENKKSFLIENFFYSLKPGIMQSIIDPKILKALFLLLTQIMENDFSEKPFDIKTISMPKYLLIMIGASSPSFKEKIEAVISSLKIASFDLTSSFIQEGNKAALGYIYRTSNLTRRAYLCNSLMNAMKEWNVSYALQKK